MMERVDVFRPSHPSPAVRKDGLYVSQDGLWEGITAWAISLCHHEDLALSSFCGSSALFPSVNLSSDIPDWL